MFEKRLLGLVLLITLLASCGPIDTGTQPQGETQPADQTPEVRPTPTDTPEPALSPLEWLVQSAFIAYAQETPNIIPAELPEGFNASEPDQASTETASGATITVFDVAFERPVGDQVYTEDYVSVQLYAYDAPEGRTEHLDRIAGEGYIWDFVELDGYRIIRYHTSSVDGRIWISGPFLIVIYTGLDTSEVGPWVDTFASLFLVMFPPQ